MKRILDINQFLHGGDYNPEQWWDEPDVINQDFALFKQAKIRDCWDFFVGQIRTARRKL